MGVNWEVVWLRDGIVGVEYFVLVNVLLYGCNWFVVFELIIFGDWFLGYYSVVMWVEGDG